MRIVTNREDGVTLSTVKVNFLNWYGDYETAVMIDGGNWRILEGYDTDVMAKIRHKFYENMSKEDLINFDYIG
ncbi:MAG: hypothetical protein J6D12_04260 [Peptostreptococcaceae bacterium]|nr:hypothetical protein [Peptostreptococcaceae bacterium]